MTKLSTKTDKSLNNETLQNKTWYRPVSPYTDPAPPSINQYRPLMAQYH